MPGRLTIKPSPLVTSLVDLMNDALQAMEAGDYDGAFQLLERRCRPSDAMLVPPKTYSQPSERIAMQLLQASPPGVLLGTHDLFLELTADVVARVMSQPLSSVDVDNLCVAMSMATECGIELEWSEIESEELGDPHKISDRVAWCRKGGLTSGETRRQDGKRPLVVKAIEHCRKNGAYGRDSASKIARYLGVTARYVRQVAAALDEIKAEVK